MAQQITHEALHTPSLAVQHSSPPKDAFNTNETLILADTPDFGEGFPTDEHVQGLFDLDKYRAVDGAEVYHDQSKRSRDDLSPPCYFPFGHAGPSGQLELGSGLTTQQSLDYPLGDVPSGPVGLQDQKDNYAQFIAFSRRLEQLQSDQTSLEMKKTMFSVIVRKILPYRYGDGARFFPSVTFYETLLYNERSREVKEFGVECAAWFGHLTAEEADHYSAVITDYHRSLQSVVSNERQVQTTSQQKKKRKPARSSRLTDHQNQLLKTELEKPLTVGYRALIEDFEDAAILDKAYLQHLRQTSNAHAEDLSWPSTKEKRRTYVKQMCEAIFDMRDFQEKKDALDKLAKLEAKRGISVEADATQQADSSRKRKLAQDLPKRIPGLSTFGAMYVDPRCTPTQLLRAVTRCDMLEVLAYCDVLPGWMGIEASLEWRRMSRMGTHHKVTIHSALRGEWLSRLAAGPVGERKMKMGNKAVNSTRDVQNELGRAELKRQRTSAGAADEA